MQKELFKCNSNELSEAEIEALGVKYLGNVYYYYTKEIIKLIRAIEKRLKYASK